MQLSLQLKLKLRYFNYTGTYYNQKRKNASVNGEKGTFNF